MRLIPLSQNLSAMVDDWQVERVLEFKWSARRDRHLIYAVHNRSLLLGPRKTIYLHRFILDAPDGAKVDHKDGNGLNCVDDNLRLCSSAGNSRNRRMAINNSSGYKGVYWYKPTGKWGVTISVDDHNQFVGYFIDILDAAHAYDDAARRLHGEFASVNFPQLCGDGME